MQQFCPLLTAARFMNSTGQNEATTACQCDQCAWFIEIERFPSGFVHAGCAVAWLGEEAANRVMERMRSKPKDRVIPDSDGGL